MDYLCFYKHNQKHLKTNKVIIFINMPPLLNEREEMIRIIKRLHNDIYNLKTELDSAKQENIELKVKMSKMIDKISNIENYLSIK